ncbi:MAG: ABC transporter ATP-binding protein [Candidimonas sp.]|nr:MAG: ABC transporter ATP-binding protein [Candidimonas sp.]TAM21949.1 MAG: ABC transporter ATP-binding protein [Candidimonas sp.]
MNDIILEIRNLTVDLPSWADRSHAVSDLSLSLHRNEILCVVGESGSGKSLMSRSIMGLLPAPHVRASAGQIIFNGEDLLKATPLRMQDVRGKNISMIFQEPMTALNPLMTVGNLVGEVLKIHCNMTKSQRIDRIVKAFDAVNLPVPEQLLRMYPHQLSGGQRQRVMIAMALILEPSVLIADEPTTALDVTTQAQILALVKEIQSNRHIGVLFITHDLSVVAEIANRVAVMQFGKLVELGDTDQVLNRPQHPYTKSLIKAVPRGIPRSQQLLDKTSPVILSVKNLEKSYYMRGGLFKHRNPAVYAVKSVSFEVRRGETLGIVGESGSGKSTLARCITRLIDSDSGKIIFNEADIRSYSRKQLRPYCKRIQMVFQDPYGSLSPRRTVGQLISEGPTIHGVDAEKAMARVYELLDLVGLDHRAIDRYPHEFSGGQRQRICIARALALDPEVLVADEPVSALDVSVQAQVLRLLADARDRLNLTMLFVTHDLRVAAQMCDTIAVMRYGEVVEYGPTEYVFSNPKHPYTQELFAAIPGRAWVVPEFCDGKP